MILVLSHYMARFRAKKAKIVADEALRLCKLAAKRDRQKLADRDRVTRNTIQKVGMKDILKMGRIPHVSDVPRVPGGHLPRVGDLVRVGGGGGHGGDEEGQGDGRPLREAVGGHHRGRAGNRNEYFISLFAFITLSKF